MNKEVTENGADMFKQKPRYAVVVVHGICAKSGSQQMGFSHELSSVVIPSHMMTICSPCWREVVWEKETNAADDKIQDVVLQCVNLYDKTHYWRDSTLEKTTSKLKKLGIYILYWCVQLLFWRVARGVTQVLDLALDLPLYLGDPRGERIRNTVVSEIQTALKDFDGIILVGHSLGSVIAYDVAKQYLQTEDNSLKIKTLITMGSPLKWITEIRRAEDGKQGPINPQELSLPGIKWINIYDKEDPIALKEELPNNMFENVENVPLESGEKFIKAHTCYWTQDKVASIVRNEMFAE